MFFLRYWQRQPLLSKATQQNRLVTLADVDELISGIGSLDDGWLMLTKDGVAKPNASVRNRDGSADLSAVYAAYDDGYTLIVTMVQQRWPSVRLVCRDLERAFLSHGVILCRTIRANLYLTPPASRGFDAHYDNHDVVVLQLEGHKHWRIYGRHRPRPIQAQRQRSEHLPPLLMEETIRPGQALYIPRGFYHEAVTGDACSLHITLNVLPCTWIDLVTRMLPSLEPFCEALPLLPDEADDSVLQLRFDELVRSLLSSGDPARVAHNLADESLMGLSVLPDDGFEQRAAGHGLTLASRVRRRRGAVARLRKDGGHARLLFPGSGFRGPREMTPLLRFVLDHAAFRIGDLPDVVPPEGKLEVVRQLVQDGLLCIDGDNDAR